MKKAKCSLHKLSVWLCALLVSVGAFFPLGERASAAAAEAPAGVCQLQDFMDMPPAPQLHSEYAVLYECKSKTVLYSKFAYAKAEPASITKVMTALLTAEKCDMAETVTFSYNATHSIEPGSSSIARTEGEQMSVLDCLYGMLLASANEVAQGLGEHISGNLTTFAALMNQRARQLGAVNTHFVNPHGLHAPEHYTCCYDMALFMTEAMEHQTLTEVMGTERYTIGPTNKHKENTYVRMYHPLLTDEYGLRYSSAVAGKTGYTESALYTLVSYAVKDDMELVCVVMKADSREECGEDSVALFNYGFDNFTRYQLSDAAMDGSKDDNPLSSDLLGLECLKNGYVTLPDSVSPTQLESELRYSQDLKDGVLATRYFYYRGNLVAEVPLSITGREPLVDPEGTESRPLSSRDRLRAKVLGVPLIYWIVILIGAAACGLLLLAALLLIRLVLRRRRERERRRRSLNRETRGR